MQLEVLQTNQFKKDLKLTKKRGLKLELLWKILELLIEQKPIPEKYKNHKLSGNWKGCWELHIQPDWLLIYQLEGNFLKLVRTGTHTDLFD